MFRSLCVMCAVLLGLRVSLSLSFVAPHNASPGHQRTAEPAVGAKGRFLHPNGSVDDSILSWGGLVLGGAAAAAAVVAGIRARRTSASRASNRAPSSFVSIASAVPVGTSEKTVRECLVACGAQLHEASGTTIDQIDEAMKQLEEVSKKIVATGAAAAFLMTSSMPVEAYPIYAQQNYKNPVDGTGKLACANCHLQERNVDIRLPHEVYPDTIFKMYIDVPCKYEKRRQLDAQGEKVPLNAGAIAVLPEGWKLAPRERLPKVIKKEMKGLAWSPYSKELPNIIVAGPVPGAKFERMVLPILAPTVDGKKIHFGKEEIVVGGNRGRGQVYPEGNASNNNVFLAPTSGTIQSIEGDNAKKTITVAKADGSTVTQEVLAGADVVVEVGDRVAKDQQLTTNPNVGGFGQDLREIILQDTEREKNFLYFSVSVYFAVVSYVLKKKQFEKVQLAEGF